VDKLRLRAVGHAAVPLAIPTEIDRSVIRITSAAAARLYPAEHARCVPCRDRGRRACGSWCRSRFSRRSPSSLPAPRSSWRCKRICGWRARRSDVFASSMGAAA